MIKVVIVEDEKPILELMKVLIGRNPHYTLIGAFNSPLEALAQLPELKPDLAFLDVEMPRMNGLELAHRINDICAQTRIVFTTAYKEYALDAFGVHAFDYILKPVSPAAIERITTRLMKQLELERLSAPAEAQAQTQTQAQKQAQAQEQERHAAINCFGMFEVRNPLGELVRWPTRKTEELFAYFLCHPNKNINKWQLVELLWPDMEEERVSHNLHNTIYRLKKMIKEQELGVDIIKTNEGYMLDTLRTVYDLLEFQRNAASLPEESMDAMQTERLCALYRGPLLDRKEYMWKTPLEEGYGKLYTALIKMVIRRNIERQEWSKAEKRLEYVLFIYPLSEDMNQLLLEVYAGSGKYDRIAKHYARFEALYRKELGLEPPVEMGRWVAEVLLDYRTDK